MVRPAYAYEGVVERGIQPPEAAVVLAAATWDGYDEGLRRAAERWPVYLRGSGQPGDAREAGLFKATMITLLGIEEFYEADPLQAEIVAARCRCHVRLVTVVAPAPNGAA